MAALPRLLAAFASLAASAGSAEAQTIRGVIVEDRTRRPVVRADVTLLEEDVEPVARARTDSLGEFAVEAPGAGRYALQVTHVSYLPYEARTVEVGDRETVTLEIRMSSSAIPLEPMVVTARSVSPLAEFDRRRRRGAFGRFLVREDIEARAGSRTTELFRGLGGLTLVPVRRGRRNLLRMRSGLGLCDPAIWIDGQEVQQSVSNSLDDLLSPEMIEGVEVYGSAAEAPAQYVSGPCGVVLIWTRRGSSREGAPWSWKKLLVGAGGALALVLFFVY